MLRRHGSYLRITRASVILILTVGMLQLTHVKFCSLLPKKQIQLGIFCLWMAEASKHLCPVGVFYLPRNLSHIVANFYFTLCAIL